MKYATQTVFICLMLSCLCFCAQPPRPAQQPAGPSSAPVQPVNPNNLTPPPDPNAGWLSVQGNQIVRNGQPWMGRGVTIHDTRGCDFCTSQPPLVAAVEHRIDAAVHDWHVNFIRLLLESYASPDYTDGSGNQRTQWQDILQDPNYLRDVVDIVHYAEQNPNVYIMLSLWLDPNFTAPSAGVQGGIPTDYTANEMGKLAAVFAQDPYVLFAVGNEPQDNNDDSEAPACYAAMNTSVEAVRAAEEANNAPHAHLVTVQGTAGWGRVLDYYVDHPIDDGHTVYETHAYIHSGDFNTSLFYPAQTLPVIIGEFAPTGDVMSYDDAQVLMDRADDAHIPWLAWDFYSHCEKKGTNNMLLFSTDQNQCVDPQAFSPTAWGALVQSHITSKQ